MQIGPATKGLQKVLDALESIKTKVTLFNTLDFKYFFDEND